MYIKLTQYFCKLKLKIGVCKLSCMLWRLLGYSHGAKFHVITRRKKLPRSFYESHGKFVWCHADVRHSTTATLYPLWSNLYKAGMWYRWAPQRESICEFWAKFQFLTSTPIKPMVLCFSDSCVTKQSFRWAYIGAVALLDLQLHMCSLTLPRIALSMLQTWSTFLRNKIPFASQLNKV